MAKAREIEKKLSHVFVMPELGNGNAVFTVEEIEFFTQNGFLIKKELIAPVHCENALESVWDYLLAHVVDTSQFGLNRDDPSTWTKPAWVPQQKADTEGFYEGRPRIVAGGSTEKFHDLGSADFLVDLLPRNPDVNNVAKPLLSHNLQPSTRTRGVYALFPQLSFDGDSGVKGISAKQLGPHSDRVCPQLNVCTYLEDVGPRSGGFTIYPGSHRIMYRAHTYGANWSPTESFRNRLAKVANTIEPFEPTGRAGDVIFWHGRTFHSAGIHVTDRIRWAVFGDCCCDRETQTDDEHREVGQYE